MLLSLDPEDLTVTRKFNYTSILPEAKVPNNPLQWHDVCLRIDGIVPWAEVSLLHGPTDCLHAYLAAVALYNCVDWQQRPVSPFACKISLQKLSIQMKASKLDGRALD